MHQPPYLLPTEQRRQLLICLHELDETYLCQLLSKVLPQAPDANLLQRLPRSQIIQELMNLLDSPFSKDLVQRIQMILHEKMATNLIRPERPILSPYFSPVFYRPRAPEQNNVAGVSPTVSIVPRAIAPAPRQRQYEPLFSLLSKSMPEIRDPAPVPVKVNPPPPAPTVIKITHKALPFYRLLTCVFQQYDTFEYHAETAQYVFIGDFVLPIEICNQLAMSYDYDPETNTHHTAKSLILRLIRLDLPTLPNGRYDDNLPPNLMVLINGQLSKALPPAKPTTRSQPDLIRPGREIDITPLCMFNPMMKNRIQISWCYRKENTSLAAIYDKAKYAVHVFLAEHRTVKELCDVVLTKFVKFTRSDMIKLITPSQGGVHDNDIEFREKVLKITCPISQRRLRIPVRATTCQHLECFDLENYLALNEKSSKWICPICMKSAPFENLQIDTCMEEILKSVPDENVTEIRLDGHLRWTCVIPPKNTEENRSNTMEQGTISLFD